MGIVTAILGSAYALLLLVGRIFGGGPVAGSSSLMAVTLILGGIIILGLGILGEYAWRILDEVRSRPSRLIRETLNIENPRT